MRKPDTADTRNAAKEALKAFVIALLGSIIFKKK